MSKSNLRIGVVVFTLITAAVHLFLGATSISGPMQTLGILWLLNGLGYLGLLAAFLGYVPFLKGNNVHWVLMAFAAITIVAWVMMSGMLKGDPSATGPLPLITKVDEVLLIVATFMHMRK